MKKLLLIFHSELSINLHSIGQRPAVHQIQLKSISDLSFFNFRQSIFLRPQTYNRFTLTTVPAASLMRSRLVRIYAQCEGDTSDAS